MRIFRAPEFLAHRVPARGARHARPPAARALSDGRACPFDLQLINLLAALLLLLAFAMLSQRRVAVAVNLFAVQGAGARAVDRGRRATRRSQPHLYCSAALTLALKVVLLPWLLHRLIRRLDVHWDVEPLINIPTTMLIGIVLVVFAFNLALPISQLASTVDAQHARHRDGVRAAVVPDDDHARARRCRR